MPVFIKDLSTEEVEKLTEEQIEHYIKLECAEAGIAIDIQMPVAPDKIGIETDLQVYKVGEFKFVNRDDAERVSALIAECDIADLGWGSPINGNYRHYLRGTEKGTNSGVEIENVFSLNRYMETKGLLECHGEKVKEYEEAKKQYDKFREKYDEIVDEVRSVVRKASRRMHERARLINLMRQYETLAEGSIEIAFRFLLKAEPNCARDFPEIFSGDWTRYAVLSRREENVESPL